MKKILCIFFVLIQLQVHAQQNRIKVGLFGIPTMQSGFGLTNIGFERIDKNMKASWQLLYSLSGGSPNTDWESTFRNWFTFERICYFKTTSRKLGYYYSGYIEVGKRRITPGYAHYPDTASLKETKVTEINPGVSLGIFLKLGKRINLETAAGPKLMFQSGKEYYRNFRDNKDFTEPYKDTKFGLRFLFSFSYQF